MQELNRNTILAAPKGGGYLDLVSQDGEILAQFFVPEGRSKATRWLDLCGPEQQLQIGENIVALEPSHRIYTQNFGEESFTSSANPDFRVSNVQRQAREMDRRLRKLEVTQSRLSAREAVLDRALASKAGTPLDAAAVALQAAAGDPENEPVIEVPQVSEKQ